jgi:hypothetical protein
MGNETWLEMPVDGGSESATRPKHAIEGNALILYRGRTAYVATQDEHAIASLLQKRDVRRLTRVEVEAIEASLPGNGAAKLQSLGSHSSTNQQVGLGDVIHWMTARLGIPECDSCMQRKERLNRVTIWHRSSDE